MSINKVVQGDLIKMALNGDFDVIVQGCNCFGVMGAGIAPQIAGAFGGDEDLVRQADLDFPLELGNKARLGHYSYLQTENVLVINAYTQHSTGGRRFGKPDVSYDAILEVFTKLNIDLENHPEMRIGIPMIGAGLAGGDWGIIKKLINDATPDLNITLVEYQPEIL